MNPTTKIPPRRAFWAAVLVQLAVLQGMVAAKQIELVRGTEIQLSTRPVDPRSLIRGDYVRLNYAVSSVSLPTREVPQGLRNGQDVFVQLSSEPGVRRALGITTTEKPGALQLRGRIQCWGRRGDLTSVELSYGIESLFVPEGTGRQIERDMRTRPLVVRVSVTPEGRPTLLGIAPDPA